jgi:hypothetical protein
VHILKGCQWLSDGGGGRLHTLAFFFEGEFTLLVVVLVLPATTILPSLFITVSESSLIKGVVAMRQRLPFPYS